MTLTDKILNNRITIVSFRSDWGTVKELSRIEVYGWQKWTAGWSEYAGETVARIVINHEPLLSVWTNSREMTVPSFRNLIACIPM